MIDGKYKKQKIKELLKDNRVCLSNGEVLIIKKVFISTYQIIDKNSFIEVEIESQDKVVINLNNIVRINKW